MEEIWASPQQVLRQSAILGVEAPLWSAIIENSDHIEFMAFPRLPAYAELGGCPGQPTVGTPSANAWPPTMHDGTTMGIDFDRSTQIPWSA